MRSSPTARHSRLRCSADAEFSLFWQRRLCAKRTLQTVPDPIPPDEELDATLQLVRAAQTGDGAALDRLLERYLPRVRQIVALRAGWRVRQMVDIEDVVQDVLLRVLKGLEQFEVRSEASFRNWLARCVEREIVDTKRHETRQKRGGGNVRRFGDCDASVLHSSIFGGDLSTPSAHARAGELADRLEDALLEMPEYQRELIVMRAVCGMSYSELAAELGIENEGAVRVAYSRALGILRQSVEG